MSGPRAAGPTRRSRRCSTGTGTRSTAPRCSSPATPAAAEDIAQEAFLAALRALDRFDVRRPLGPWLHRIVVNRAIDWCRARALRAEVAAVAVEAGAEDAPGGAPLGDAMVGALQQLPPEQRAVVVLRFLLDLTPGEIARALDLPRGTVNSRLRRGLDALGELIG